MKILSTIACSVLILAPLTAAHELDMKHPTTEQIQGIKDVRDSKVLSDYVYAVIEQSEGELYHQKVKHAVESHLSTRASSFYFVITFIGLWGNGGMQHVLLCDPDEIDYKQWELKKVAESFRVFGCKQHAEFIDGLIPKSAKWSKAISELNQREDRGEKVPEEAFNKIWSEVDAFDDPFDKGFDGDPDIYEAMTKDFQQHPEKYLPPSK
jgi:hypothetical protein